MKKLLKGVDQVVEKVIEWLQKAFKGDGVLLSKMPADCKLKGFYGAKKEIYGRLKWLKENGGGGEGEGDIEGEIE